jgi:hypothetical protein
VREKVRDRDRRLAALAELGDQIRDGCRQREVAALDPLERRSRRRAAFRSTC